MPSRQLLLISGSLREGSTNTAAITTAASLVPAGWTAEVNRDMGELPHFNPDDDTDAVPASVARLRSAIASSDAVMMCTPEYAGGLPGSFKNLLDWTVGGMEIVGKPCAWLNVSANPSRAADAHDSLRKVLGFTGADIVDAACVHAPVTRSAVVDNGSVTSRVFTTVATGAVVTLAQYASAKGR
ncbi:NADPH-dependent FMN reductase [Rhodococcus sp. G-MC3]|uniref:NADPH-dependent FMN reductase n=1 Tax=Rhodococcus sp. G-MC3 TaxID=3046209 RepID=UPI0024BB3F78|nr:NADPH-dependent FMN reductase [Rhodococcus sp. G-MC3]MDJ0394568.1 NADPH-dependent FMN reductase [Rhodococcus sp. G-MC3]